MFAYPAYRLEPASTTEVRVHLSCLFETAVALIPIDVLHECVNIHSGIRAKIHGIGMLEHIVYEDWPAERNVIGVVKRNVVVKLSIAKVEVQNSPATAAAQC